ncbi:MAG TPA: DNA repair protein RadC [Anaerolineales bacterium]|nr:DNA repair protein RadC [Anaerolineales bacterium]
MPGRPVRHRIADLQQGDRPRERLANQGARALRDEEIVAILLRTGTQGASAVDLSRELLHDVGGVGGLRHVRYDQLRTRHGFGDAKAAQLLAAIELGRRFADAEVRSRRAIQRPDDVAELLRYEIGGHEQEHLVVVLLDTRNRLIAVETVYRGSLNTSVIRVGEIFRSAIRANAASLIVAHNHPSGDPTPSPEDVAVTRAFVEAGKLLDIEVLDHLIIGKDRHTSLRAAGLGFA